MPSTDAYNFDGDAAQRIVRATLAVENMAGTDDPGPWTVYDSSPPKQGKLTQDLDAPEEFGAPATATMDVYVPDPEAPYKLISADYEILVTNRDPMLAAAEDDWLRVIFVNGEWQPSGRNPCDYVQFVIDSASCEDGTATVTIEARTCACSRVPGEYGADKLDVVDDTCFFENEDAPARWLRAT